MKPEIIIQHQLEAYNAKKLDTFLSYYSTHVEIYNFQDNAPYIQGIEKLKRTYKEVFESSPNLEAEINNRIVFDNKVIDHEKVKGRKGINFIEVVVIYEIQNNLIRRVTFIRTES